MSIQTERRDEHTVKRVLWWMIFGATTLAILVATPRAQSAAPPPQVPSSSTPIALVGERIYVSPFRKAIENGVLVIRDGKIAAVGRRGRTRIPPGAGILNCSGMFITAGFQNSDVHFTEEKWANAGQLPADELKQQLQGMLTRYGFTSAVDTGSDLANTVALRNRINSGEVMGPQILTAGIPLYPPNGVPYYLKGSTASAASTQWAQPKTPTEAVKDVDENIAGGADIITIFTGAWVSPGQAVTMPLEVAQAAVQEAHRHGKLVFAQPSNAAGLRIALEAKADVLERAAEEPQGWNLSYTQEMKSQGMSLISTLTPFLHDSGLNEILTEVRDYANARGQILFGTDLGRSTGSDPTNEYLLMKRAGMDFWHILDSLTTAPAERFGEANRRGQIQAGMDADLVVLGRDPQQDIRALTHVNYTFRDGRVLYSVINP